jgi:hypothetical protein
MLIQSWKDKGQCNSVNDLHIKLGNLSGDLARWGQHTFGNIQFQIRSLQKELGELRNVSGRNGPGEREKEITMRLAQLLEQEEVMWKQRSRIQWLAAGDKNTCFFHLRASQRRKKNKVSELQREDGTLVNTEQELGALATNFYKNL